jgi:hypothetical protein
MKHFSLSIDRTLLFQLLELTFQKLPAEYSKALEVLKKGRPRTYFRDTLISKYIGIAASAGPIFSQFQQAHQFASIFITTTYNSTTELILIFNDHGLIGISIGENLEDLQLDTINTDNFRVEPVPVSPFYHDEADLEGIEGFEEIGDYYNDFSEEYIIAGVRYYSLIHISTEKCIAIDEKKAVYLLYKMTGLVKPLDKRPQQFSIDFKNGRYAWIFE